MSITREDRNQISIEVSDFFKSLTKKYSLEDVKWAFNRKLQIERSRKRLENEKAEAEAKLKEINQQLGE